MLLRISFCSSFYCILIRSDILYKVLTVLPLQNYLHLDAQYAQNSKSVFLTWKDDNPDMYLYYVLQKSDDGTDWENIESHPVKESSYQYNDKSIQPNTHYKYRIQSIDKDGNTTYSNITEVLISAEPAFVTLYPNPVQHTAYLAIGIEYTQTVICKIISIDGKQVIAQSKEMSTGYHIWDISDMIENLQAGMYIVLVQTDKKQFEHKLILTH